MLEKITEKELRMQEAIGSLSEEYRNNLCRNRTPKIAKGKRRCRLCGLKCIEKGDEFYEIEVSSSLAHRSELFNICKSCSWLTIQTINRIIEEHNINQDRGKDNDRRSRNPRTKVKGRVRKTTRSRDGDRGNN